MSSYLDWHVGMKVACTRKDAWETTKPGENHPVYGGIYTISKVGCIRGTVALQFVEIVNPKSRKNERGASVEASYAARNFRKVQPRKTDISCFTAILNGARVPEDA